MKDPKRFSYIKLIIGLLGLNSFIILMGVLFFQYSPLYSWDFIEPTYELPINQMIAPPIEPPDPLYWEPRTIVYDCSLRTPTERDYTLMDAIATHNLSLEGALPGYLQKALAEAKDNAALDTVVNKDSKEKPKEADIKPHQYSVKDLLEFISYEDMKNIVLLIHRDARRFHGEPYVGFSRYLWVEEFSGVQYDGYNGIPERDEKGELVYRRVTTWQEKRDLKEPLEIDNVLYSFTRGLYNKDPRVRLECLSVLNEMGPNPKIQEDIQQAGQLLETVGDYNRGFRFFIPNDEDIKRAEKGKRENLHTKEVLTRRYVYCDIDGAPHWAVPYYEFAQYNRKIQRMKMLYRMEVEQSVSPSDFRVMDANMFVTLTDSINIRGAYGIDRATSYGIAPHLHPEMESQILGKEDWNGIFPEYEYAETSKDIPKNLYIRNQSAFSFLVKRVLPPWETNLPETVWQKAEMDEKGLRKLVVSLFGGLEHENYYVRIRAANFLYQLYQSSYTSKENKKLILNATLTNRTLRETMKAEFIPRKRIERLHMYISANDYDGIRDDIIQYDKELGDELFQRFTLPKVVKKDHTPIERSRKDDGSIIK